MLQNCDTIILDLLLFVTNIVNSGSFIIFNISAYRDVAKLCDNNSGSFKYLFQINVSSICWSRSAAEIT